MTHVHEWRFALNIEKVSTAKTNRPGFYCAEEECGAYILLGEAVRRLNATERLSAEDAKRQATEHDCMDDQFRANLFAYAAALEDE